MLKVQAINTVTPVLQSIAREFPQYYQRTLVTVAKRIAKDVKTGMQTQNIYGRRLPAVAQQTLVLRRLRKINKRGVGGKLQDLLRWQLNQHGISVGWLPGFGYNLTSPIKFASTGSTMWTHYMNKQLMKANKRSLLQKTGRKTIPPRPIFDYLYNNPQVEQVVEVTAYNHIKRLLGLKMKQGI